MVNGIKYDRDDLINYPTLPAVSALSMSLERREYVSTSSLNSLIPVHKSDYKPLDSEWKSLDMLLADVV